MTTIFNKKMIGFILFLIVITYQLHAQDSLQVSKENTKDNKIVGVFINPEIGAYNSTGLLRGIEGAILTDKKIIGVSYAMAEQILGPQKINIINLSYGGYLEEKMFRLHGQVGVSMLWGHKNETRSNHLYFLTAGIPVKAGFKFIPLKYVGIGLDLQANLNLEYTMFMPTFSIQVGKLR